MKGKQSIPSYEHSSTSPNKSLIQNGQVKRNGKTDIQNKQLCNTQYNGNNKPGQRFVAVNPCVFRSPVKVSRSNHLYLPSIRNRQDQKKSSVADHYVDNEVEKGFGQLGVSQTSVIPPGGPTCQSLGKQRINRKINCVGNAKEVIGRRAVTVGKKNNIHENTLAPIYEKGNQKTILQAKSTRGNSIPQKAGPEIIPIQAPKEEKPKQEAPDLSPKPDAKLKGENYEFESNDVHITDKKDCKDGDLTPGGSGNSGGEKKIEEDIQIKHFMWPITPTNLEEEEEAFFKSGCKINPQFEYERPKMAIRMMKCFKKPAGNFLSLAVKIIEAFLKTYKSESAFLETDGGEMVSQEETTEIFQKYIDELKLTDLVKLNYSYNTVSPTTISHDFKTGQSFITIGLPVEYRRNRIMGVLNHEIGTHFLRNYNDKFQPWCGHRRKFVLKNYLNTEEGLASLNQLYHIVHISIFINI